MVNAGFAVVEVLDLEGVAENKKPRKMRGSLEAD
jgi:hypothetical protein